MSRLVNNYNKWQYYYQKSLEDLTRLNYNLSKESYLEEGKLGSRLMKLGIFLFFVPVPIISEVIGIVIITIGFLFNKFRRYSSNRYSGIYLDLGQIIEYLHDYRKSIYKEPLIYKEH